MASTDTYDEIKSFLQTTFAPTPVIDFDTLDKALQQSQSNFLCVEDLISFEDLVGFGDQSGLCVREDASLMVHAFVPAPQSSGLARKLAEQVQAAMRFQNLPNGVRIGNVSPPEPEQENDGLWTAASVSVEAVTDRHVARP